MKGKVRNRMMLNSLKSKKERMGGKNGNNNLSSIKSAILDDSFGFYDQDYFKELLVLERKRCERSGKKFLLVFVEVASLLRSELKKEIAKKISTAVRASCREIDIKGWYEKNQIIGLLYVEVDVLKTDSIINKLREKFAEEMPPEIFDQPGITYMVFPQDKELKNDKDETTSILYPMPAEKNKNMRISLTAKRALDIIGSLFAICLFLPFFIIIPILIKCTSKGPVFFKQKRIGMYGKYFTFLKFRSMYVSNNNDCHKEFVTQFIKNSDKEKKSGAKRIYKIKDDPRVTPIGRFLRKTSLDELPQFLNVLIGNMSLVGPRPCLPYEFENYGLWHKRRILETKPGITCIWQVAGRSTTTFEEMVRMDIEYITKWSLLLDVKLLARTPFAVFAAKGAF
jgi:lipopolysaccharide/colanic/teichoic acid biosynthesis glycosyltransferase